MAHRCYSCKHIEERDPDFDCSDCKTIQDGKEIDLYEPYTNADRIRNMTDEELASFIKCARCDAMYGSTCEQQPYCEGMMGKTCNAVERIDKGLLEWLQAEVKEGNSNENT